jgi:hypothetical protein
MLTATTQGCQRNEQKQKDPYLKVWNTNPELRKSHLSLSQITFEQHIAIVSLLIQMLTNSDLQEAKSGTVKRHQELISAWLVVEHRCWANQVAYGWVSKIICLQQNIIFNYPIYHQPLCIKLYDMCFCVGAPHTNKTKHRGIYIYRTESNSDHTQ